MKLARAVARERAWLLRGEADDLARLGKGVGGAQTRHSLIQQICGLGAVSIKAEVVELVRH